MNQHDTPPTEASVARNQPPPPPEPRPFGPWATVIIGAALLLAIELIGANLAALMMSISAQLRGAPMPDDPQELAQTGGFVAAMQPFKLVLALMAMAVVALLCKLPWSSYYGRWGFTWRQAGGWLLGMTLLLGAAALGLVILGQPVVLDWVISVYETATWMPYFVVALCVLAPIYEELFFRGFLLRGLEQSRLGATGGIVVSSALWAAIHLQYPLQGVVIIFIMGLFLGVAWVKTRSLGLVILLHGAANALTLMQIAYVAAE
ncbi:MAG: CPBP family intramembrane glutamic endopeptidase [Candidatus Hydrogenedentota bacterium]